MDKDNKQRISLYLDRDLVKRADRFKDDNNFKSRNDFYAEAVEFYMAMAETQTNKTLNKIYQQLFENAAAANRKMLSACLYRYAVDIDIIMRMFAGITNYTKEEIANYRHEAMNNIRRTRGRIASDDIAAGYYHDVNFDE